MPTKQRELEQLEEEDYEVCCHFCDSYNVSEPSPNIFHCNWCGEDWYIHKQVK